MENLEALHLERMEERSGKIIRTYGLPDPIGSDWQVNEILFLCPVDGIPSISTLCFKRKMREIHGELSMVLSYT